MNIREFRKEQLLTLDEFALKVGVSRNSVVKWEKGTHIRPSNLRKIAQAFNLSNTEVLLFCQ